MGPETSWHLDTLSGVGQLNSLDKPPGDRGLRSSLARSPPWTVRDKELRNRTPDILGPLNVETKVPDGADVVKTTILI